MNQLQNLGKPPPYYLGDAWLNDGFGLQYRFHRYTIGSRPYVRNSVYVLMSLQAGFMRTWPRPVYIGRTEDAHDRFGDHERMREALNHGAVETWVHTPGWSDPVGFYEAERRLIRTYQPALCTQNPIPLGLFGDLFADIQSQPKSPSLGGLFGSLAPARR